MSGDLSDLDRATDVVRATAPGYDLPQALRHGASDDRRVADGFRYGLQRGRAFPHAVGLANADHPDPMSLAELVLLLMDANVSGNRKLPSFPDYGQRHMLARPH